MRKRNISKDIVEVKLSLSSGDRWFPHVCYETNEGELLNEDSPEILSAIKADRARDKSFMALAHEIGIMNALNRR